MLGRKVFAILQYGLLFYMGLEFKYNMSRFDVPCFSEIPLKRSKEDVTQCGV